MQYLQQWLDSRCTFLMSWLSEKTQAPSKQTRISILWNCSKSLSPPNSAQTARLSRPQDQDIALFAMFALSDTTITAPGSITASEPTTTTTTFSLLSMPGSSPSLWCASQWTVIIGTLYHIYIGLGRGAAKDPSKNPLGALCFFGVCNAKPVFLGLGFFELLVSTLFFFPVT